MIAVFDFDILVPPSIWSANAIFIGKRFLH